MRYSENIITNLTSSDEKIYATEDTAKKGLKVKLVYHESPIGIIEAVGPCYYTNMEIVPGKCVVSFGGQYSVVCIGYNDRYDLYFASKRVYNLKLNKNGKENRRIKSIKVQSFTAKIRQGNRIKAVSVKSKEGKAKCSRRNE